MIREPYPTSGDDDDVFAALIKGNWEKEPSLREKIDPGILRLLNDAKSAEDALNYAKDPSEETIQEVILNLNGDWDMLGFRDDPIKITGRLRPTENALEEDVVDNAAEDAFPGLGEYKEDLLGEYFEAAGFRTIVKGFDVEKVPMGDHGFIYRVVMELSLDEDYNEEQVWFTAYPDDIEYMDAYQPTREGAEEFVRVNFPDVYEAVQALPDDCRDPELIREVLDDFSLTFDLSQADTAMGQDEVLDLIETYITDRLAFDNATYDADIRGTIYGQTMTHSRVPKEYTGTLRELLISNLRLAPTPDTEEGQQMVTYRPVLEAWYLVPEAQGGRTPVYIPIDSLTKLVANRPDAKDYPFDEDTYLVQNEQFDGGFEVQPLTSSVGQAALSLAEHDSHAESTQEESEEIAENGYDVSEKERKRQFLTELHGLHAIISQYASSNAEHVYPSRAALEPDYDMVNDRVEAFFKRWQQEMNPVIEVSGEAVRLPTAKMSRTVNHEDGTFDLRVEGLGVHPESMFNTARGILVEAHVQAGSAEIDGETVHLMRAYLEFVDISGKDHNITINDPVIGVPMLSVGTTRRFFVDLGLPGGYALPELEYDERRSAALERVEKLEINGHVRSILQRNLETLATAIDNESATGLEEYESVEGLRDLALSATDNQHVMNVTADALEAVLGTGRTLQVIGPYIDDAGDIVTEQGLIAKLDGVITQHPNLKTNEISFVMLVPAYEPGERDQRFVVPLSTLEELEF